MNPFILPSDNTSVIKDRYFDLLDLSMHQPQFFYEPGCYDDSTIDPDIFFFLKLADKVRIYLDILEEKLIVLQQLHADSLSSSSDYFSKKCRKKISDVCDEFTSSVSKAQRILNDIRPSDKVLTHYFSHLLKDYQNNVRWGHGDDCTTLQVPLHRFRWMMTRTPDLFVPADIRMQILQYNIRSLQLKELCHEFFTMQKIYNDKSRAKINRQIAIIQNVTKYENGIQDGYLPDSDDDERKRFLHPRIKDDVQVSKEMQDKLRNVAYFENEIYGIERSISKLYNSYLFVSNMVFEQGAMIDRVETHLNMSSDYVESGNVGLKKAHKLQDKYRKKKLILAILLLVLLGTIIAVTVGSVESNQHHQSSHKLKSRMISTSDQL